MNRENLLLLTYHDVQALLSGREGEIIDTVRTAYVAHGRGADSLPHSSFLRFPDEPRNRIIALPAYLGEGFEVAGIKWISSFPGNHALGMDRASAVIILNSVRTGRPEAVIEGSLISAKRTAASAALAARTLLVDERPATAGLIGCGLINLEIARFLKCVWPGLNKILVYDLIPDRAAAFKERLEKNHPEIEVVVADHIAAVLAATALTTFATTAVEPHFGDLSVCPKGSVILHISLRDLTPEAILSGDNVVDDIDHVCRAQTSAHLAEQRSGDRRFIRCALHEILAGTQQPRRNPEDVTIFSPFGLGILDLAVARLVDRRARAQRLGVVIESFLPEYGAA
jgi:N-[(2S)-2-amino-2-carboxyethyl]-L-glutamate dehydrogenase